MKKIYEEMKLSVVVIDETTDIICSSAEPSEETFYDVGGQWKSEWFN